MSLIRIANPDTIRPGHAVMIVLVLLTLAGSCLLSSGARSTNLPDGAKEWPADSLFRALVEMLNFHYAQPTPTGTEIKNLVFGLGVALAVLSVSLAIVLRTRGEEETDENDAVITDPAALERAGGITARKHIPPLYAAQVLMLAYVAWSFASAVWSGAAALALYGSAELALYALWSFALAYGLSRASARFGAYALAAVGTATAAMAVGYVIERNPTLRASYPIGNPTFLAACLVPAMLVTAGILTAQVRDFGNPRWVRRAGLTLLCLGALLVMWVAFRRADARGAALGLAVGFLALFFFAWKTRGKLVVLAILLIGGAVAAGLLVPRMTHYSPTGRDASLRVRYYAWNYALQLIGERRLLGHGQGGYTRKADALAAGKDVLVDPEALTARLANAHNEWLEVWTDLGSVGLVLVLGALFFTLFAGATAVRAVPGVTLRWVLIALLASLTALIVEETSGSGLRVTGLPPFFYTVVGLIWAACMPDQPGVVHALRRNGLTRGISMVVAAGLALSTAYLSIRDFQAARAQYEVAGAIDRLDWDRALLLAHRAHQHRLSPQRRLVAQGELCAAYLHLARVHQVNGMRRGATAMQSQPYDQPLLALADQDVRAAEAYVRRGTEILQDQVRRAPNFYNSNWQEYGFEQIRADLARLHGDFDAARAHDQNSAAALKRELIRRPYDTNIAARYVLAAGSVISLEEICASLVRPLRYSRVPVAYHDIATRLLTIPTFKTELLPIYERARSAAPTEDPARWADPFAPETLRLAAVVWVADGADDLAEETLECAAALYAALPPRFAYGAAACFAELADRHFLNRPLEPTPALRDAEEAVNRAPLSYEGRQLVQVVRWAMVRMELAAGDEVAARALLSQLLPQNSEPLVCRALSTAYADLVSVLMRGDGEAHVDRLRRWVDQAVELDDENELAWRLKADVAFREGDDVECVRCLREARGRGADDQIIYRFVDLALQERPTCQSLLDYSAELGRELRAKPPATTPMSEPQLLRDP
ncbi:MAG: O-antigen ligase family protein [Planctomycetota bacterium]